MRIIQLSQYYFQIWKREVRLSSRTTFAKRVDASTYALGKLFRFLFFILLLSSIFHHSRDFLGYNMAQVVLIFLTFNLIDTIAQIFFRGLYGLGKEVSRGLFDFALIRPANTLFLVMTRLTDVLDILFLVPIFVGYVILWPMLQITWWSVVFFLLLVVTGVVIATALHIMMAALIIRMQEDSILMLFRMLGRFAMFPQETYHEAVRFILIFIFPVFTMMVFPGQALVGKLNPAWLPIVFCLALIFFSLSIIVWRRALTSYSSASS